MAVKKPLKKRKRNPVRLLLEILEVKRQLRDVLEAQQRMERKMTQQFDNLKVQVEGAVVSITQAIERIVSSDNPADIQAEADKLGSAVAALNEALSPTPEEPPVEG